MNEWKKRKPGEEDQTPSVANGIDDDEELNAEATKDEIARGDYTKVTKLVWDEYDPSGKED
ncbi:hypothetical protein ACFO4N_14590 [Camelliibacillus cellulosilyticus]|uniref:Uncharacterized protein n=1 Tax=Camelliibacillus cellulosilyticus TaxID=2174486 RepID=A0ABV9GSM0_9BACL